LGEGRLSKAVTRRMFRETGFVMGNDKYTPRMQSRNELDTSEETIFKTALCYKHKN